MGKIFVTSRDAVLDGDPYQHTNLVYDADGDPYTKGDQQIIRGGLDTGLLSGPYYIEAGRPNSSSRDELGLRNPYSDNNFTTVYSGSDAANVWSSMVQAARSLGQEQADPDSRFEGRTVIVPDHPYNLSQNACNTLTSTILYMTGFDTLSENLPQWGGDTGSGESMGPWRFPGADSHLASAGDSNIVVSDSMASSLDQGGADTYIIDGSRPRKTPLTIIEDANTGTNVCWRS